MSSPNSPFDPPPSSNPYAAPPTANPYAAPISDGQAYNPGIYGAPGNDLPLAERSTRFFGSLLDGLLMMVFAVPGLFLFGGMDALEGGDVMALYLAIGGPILLVSFVQWYLIATSGQSVAKKLLGMKIVKMDGSDVDFVSGVILRGWVVALLGAIPVAGNFVGLVDALMIFGEEQRCLHDKIAGTKVIAV